MAGVPRPGEGAVLTQFVVASDIGRSRRFYADVLGGQVVRDGEPTIIEVGQATGTSAQGVPG